MNLFVGVIVDSFNRIKRKLEEEDSGGTATMTKEQQQWAKTMIAFVSNADIKKKSSVTYAPSHPLRLAFYNFITSAPFEGAIFVVITANVTLMASDYWKIEVPATH